MCSELKHSLSPSVSWSLSCSDLTFPDCRYRLLCLFLSLDSYLYLCCSLHLPVCSYSHSQRLAVSSSSMNCNISSLLGFATSLIHLWRIRTAYLQNTRVFFRNYKQLNVQNQNSKVNLLIKSSPVVVLYILCSLVRLTRDKEYPAHGQCGSVIPIKCPQLYSDFLDMNQRCLIFRVRNIDS